MATSKSKSSTNTDADLHAVRDLLELMHEKGVTHLHLEFGDRKVSLTVPIPLSNIPVPLREEDDSDKDVPDWKKSGRALDRELFGDED